VPLTVLNIVANGVENPWLLDPKLQPNQIIFRKSASTRFLVFFYSKYP
jgi:hypothetical protein